MFRKCASLFGFVVITVGHAATPTPDVTGRWSSATCTAGYYDWNRNGSEITFTDQSGKIMREKIIRVTINGFITVTAGSDKPENWLYRFAGPDMVEITNITTGRDLLPERRCTANNASVAAPEAADTRPGGPSRRPLQAEMRPQQGMQVLPSPTPQHKIFDIRGFLLGENLGEAKKKLDKSFVLHEQAGVQPSEISVLVANSGDQEIFVFSAVNDKIYYIQHFELFPAPANTLDLLSQIGSKYGVKLADHNSNPATIFNPQMDVAFGDDGRALKFSNDACLHGGPPIAYSAMGLTPPSSGNNFLPLSFPVRASATCSVSLSVKVRTDYTNARVAQSYTLTIFDHGPLRALFQQKRVEEQQTINNTTNAATAKPRL